MEENPDSNDVAQQISGLFQRVVQLYQQGRYQEAITLASHARDFACQHLGKKHPHYAGCLNSLAMLYQATGDQAAAMPFYRQALEIFRVALGENHPDYAECLHNLAALYSKTGDHAAALPLRRQLLEIDRTALGENHPDYAASLNNLAVLYSEMGDHAAALPLYRRALKTTRTALGEGHPDYAACLNNLGELYRTMGDHAAALPLCRQALEIRRRALGENHPAYATSLNNLAQLYRTMGDHATALPLYRQALESTRTALGENHPSYALSLNNLAVLYVATDRASEALALMEKAAAIDDRMIGQVLGISSDRQRIAYLETVVCNLHMFLSLVQQHLVGSPSAVRAALDLVLRRKAIAAEAMAAQRDVVLGGKYPALEPRLRELADLRMQIARETLAGPGPESLESRLRRLGEWNTEKERLEAELARQIPEMNLEQKLRAADRRAVTLSLSDEVALIEFVCFLLFDFQAVPARGEPQVKAARYIAFVLPGGAPDDVQMIDLGEAEPIDRLITDFRAGVVAEAEAGDGRDMAKRRDKASPRAEHDAGLALRAALFDRLVPALDARRRLLIAPDGALTRLPFEVLPTTDGGRLIDDYRISYLSCGRDVLRFGSVATSQPGDPLVLADPDFDLEAMAPTGPEPAKPGFWSRLLGRGKRAIGTPAQSVPTPATAALSIGRHSRDLDGDRSAYHFHRLPGTRAEGERVATRLGVSPWLDATALEGRLKTACCSPRIFHVATHGFFLPDQERDHNREGRGLGFEVGDFSGAPGGLGRFSGPMMENPMLRSGLALAGANTFLKAGTAPEDAEDGLLTAEDVTGLDLLATELVVLSACETGLGQIHVGEGVFGLRRAFVLAGAKTLVMSLWKVPDEPTRQLMEDFYRRLLAGEGRAEALRQAQLALKAKYPHPFHWGAFICQGDPSPLGTVRPGSAGIGVATDRPTGCGVSVDRY
jgi:CHAT domain-containing protein/tetratricopeptide (TPR) repeat protein